MARGKSPAITSNNFPAWAGVALGSNLGDRAGCLRAARTAIMALPGVQTETCLAAPFYQTTPVGCGPDAGPFLNTVLAFAYDGEPTELLDGLLRIEAAAGRSRQPGRTNESRPLDLDLLYAGDRVLALPALTLPHPRLVGRRFVLAPLAAIQPALILPGQTASIVEILAGLDDDPSAVSLADEQW